MGSAENAPLPPHSVRVSNRASRIALRVLPGKGLEVVLPRRADPACVPSVLERHRRWIEKQLNRLADRALYQNADGDLPRSMLLCGGQEEVRIFLHHLPPAPLSFATRPDTRSPLESAPLSSRNLVVNGDSPADVRHFLREWIRAQARERLGDMLAALAKVHAFRYSALTIRFQRGRWGSCSSKGGISLNACLLFLPERLVRYILLHELCHTRQMNHSQAFWKELFAIDPDALVHDKAMRTAWRHVPAWVFL